MEYNGYNIVGDGTFGNLSIKNIGPGTIPVSLSGIFTKYPDAQIAIDRYSSLKQVALDLRKAKRDMKPTPIKLKKTKKE